MIIVIEEVDIILKRIVGTIAKPNNIISNSMQSDISDKISWNNTIDKLKRMNNIILIMNTNKTIKEINEICCDTSYIRKHRVDYLISIKKDHTVIITDPA
jgi:hypothetical protein